MSRTIRRGLMAGAAGTAALNAVTYLDMALRGRPASTTPERTVEAATARTRLDVPGAGAVREARTTALGALGGIATGLAVGIGASAARTAGLRLPARARLAPAPPRLTARSRPTSCPRRPAGCGPVPHGPVR